MYQDLENELKSTLTSDVYFDEIYRQIYSVDASIYEIEPIAVIIAKTVEDIQKAVLIAGKYQVAVIARGAATGITGGVLGKALIIDLSVHLKSILTINFHKQFAIVEPGVVQDNLNKMLSICGFRLGPDTSTGDRATIGGMTANNSAGARSLFYGKMVDHVTGIEMILSNGDLVYFEEVDEVALEKKLQLQTLEGHIYREVVRIKNTYKDEIVSAFPNIPRRVSGYNLDELLKPGPLNLSKLIVGSEGTLGIITKIKVNITLMPKYSGLAIIFFENLKDAFESVPKLLSQDLLSLELIDQYIVEAGRSSPSVKGKLGFLREENHNFLAAEMQAETEELLNQKLIDLQRFVSDNQIGLSSKLVTKNEEMAEVWALRKAGLGLLLSKRSYSRAIAFIEDLSISPYKLSSFMDKFQSYMDANQKTAGIYGHVGSGCMHIRPFINLKDKTEVALMEKMMHDISSMVLEHQGALSGEHGDGIVRSWLNKKMFGDKVYQAFKELKAAFDPSHMMNPGKIVDGLNFLDNLRLSPEKPTSEISTFLNFSKEGGFELAVDLCNGNGSCRKGSGLMCPSFQATENEYDSTRARAQSLRALIHSPKSKIDLANDAIYDVLDLCLQCKGCKTECPSQVDMAKIKTEVLHHYRLKNGLSLRNYLFGHISSLFWFGSLFPRVSNFLLFNPFSKMILSFFGIARERNLPKLSLKRFSSFKLDNKTSNNKVVLFNDTYTEFITPEIGISAYKVLTFLGYEVITPPWSCCGRPLLSKGLLPEAKEKAKKLIAQLKPFVEQNMTIVGIEPSCILTIKDDFPSFFKDEEIKEIIDHCKTFDEFVSHHLNNCDLSNLNVKPSNVKYHMHCYQKSLVGSTHTENILRKLNCDSSEIHSGCCGMAGSFGYEEEHYSISMKIANLKLFPTIKHTSTDVDLVASGFSCRSQIESGTKRQVLHLAQFLEKILAI